MQRETEARSTRTRIAVLLVLRLPHCLESLRQRHRVAVVCREAGRNERARRGLDVDELSRPDTSDPVDNLRRRTGEASTDEVAALPLERWTHDGKRAELVLDAA